MHPFCIRDEKSRDYFNLDKEISSVYSDNVNDFVATMSLASGPTEWRLFVDTSIRSLKAVLLYNDNKISSVHKGYSVQMFKKN